VGEAATTKEPAVGESVASVQKYDAQPENVTSMREACSLRLGCQAMMGKTIGCRFCARGVSHLDPNFDWPCTAGTQAIEPGQLPVPPRYPQG